MIPKIIHYCWFGGGEKSDLMKSCIASWKKYCPDYEIKEWNESNFDYKFCLYAEKAYKKKKWAYLTDVARLKIIYENGGIYLDTDVELISSLDKLLEYDMWIGYGPPTEINTGSGFGAVCGNDVVKQLMDSYLKLPEDSKFELCTSIDTKTLKGIFPEFKGDGSRQLFGNNVILGDIWRYVIHHYTNTWAPKTQPIKNMLVKFSLVKWILKRKYK